METIHVLYLLFSFKEYESSSETERSDILVILGIFYPYWLTDIAVLSKDILYLAKKTEKIIKKSNVGFYCVKDQEEDR